MTAILFILQRASAVVLASYLGRFIPAAANDAPLAVVPVPWVPLTISRHSLVAIAAIALMSWLHLRGVGPGRVVGNVLAVFKVLALLIFIALGFSLGTGSMRHLQEQGGTVGPARELVHGKACTVSHDGRGLFAGLPAELEVGRYHSLAARAVPEVLEVSAAAEDGEVMGVRHRELPVDGVQFHPESVLTPLGREIARNFLERT